MFSVLVCFSFEDFGVAFIALDGDLAGLCLVATSGIIV